MRTALLPGIVATAFSLLALPAALSAAAAAVPATPASAPAPAGDVTLTLNGQSVKPGDYAPADVQALVLDNGLLKLTFGKDVNGDFSATSVVKNGRELAHNLHGVEPRDVDARRSFYLDTGAGRGHLETDVVRVVRNTPELAHFAVVDNRALHLEHHFVMLKGESGVHPYVIIKSAPGQNTGETRTMYRFDRDILDWCWTNERVGQQPKYAFLQQQPELGDETWRLPDGSVYQKYDYSVYYAEAPMWGHYGHGFGVFFIPTSTESYAGGPLRHELVAHQDALILNYIGGGHYSGGGTAAGRTGEKIHGPWYLYFNTGDTPEAIIADALQVAAAEKAKWPYAWVEEPLYPVNRTKVTGQLQLTHHRPASHAYVILGQPGGGGGRAGGQGGRGNRGTRGAEAARGGGISPEAGRANSPPPESARSANPSPETVAASNRGPSPDAGTPNRVSPEAGGATSPSPEAQAGPRGPSPEALARAGGARSPEAEAPRAGGRGQRGGRGAGGGGAPTAADRASALYTQAGDYIFYVKADADGKFTLPNVRPGTYTLYAWQTEGPVTQSFAKDGVVISGATADLGVIEWDAPHHPNLLWQIGQPDRMAGEFKLGDQPRTNQLTNQVPADMTFTVGRSNPATDWYFAQKPGTWNIAFNVDKVPAGNAYLTIARAGGQGNVNVLVNGQEVGTLNHGDDASVRRAANRSAQYARHELTFPATLLKPGANTVTLRMNSGYGVMYDTLVLESD